MRNTTGTVAVICGGLCRFPNQFQKIWRSEVMDARGTGRLNLRRPRRFRISQDLPEPLWSQLQQRATREGWTLKALVIQLVEDYLDGRIAPSRKSLRSNLKLRCASGHDQTLTAATRTAAAKWAAQGAVPCFACRQPIPLSPEQRDVLVRWSPSYAWPTACHRITHHVDRNIKTAVPTAEQSNQQSPRIRRP